MNKTNNLGIVCTLLDELLNYEKGYGIKIIKY